MATPAISLKRVMVGREVRRMIEDTTVFQSQDERATHARVAQLMETRQSRITALTKGEAPISQGELLTLANRLGFTDPEYQGILLELNRDSHKRGYWTTGYNRAYFPDMRLLVDIEGSADLIHAAYVEIIPGLVQCEEYIRVLDGDSRHQDETVTFDDMVQARLARQEILDDSRTSLRELRIVMSESCLRRQYGTPLVMQRQMEHLIKFSQHPKVYLQVLPFQTVARNPLYVASSFTLLRVPSAGMAGPLEIAYSEGTGEIRYMDTQKALDDRKATWSNFSSNAMSEVDSRHFLDEVAADWERLARRRLHR